jgi:hypothetical protein
MNLLSPVHSTQYTVHSTSAFIYRFWSTKGTRGPVGAFGRNLLICGGPSGGKVEALIDPSNQAKREGGKKTRARAIWSAGRFRSFFVSDSSSSGLQSPVSSLVESGLSWALPLIASCSSSLQLQCKVQFPVLLLYTTTSYRSPPPPLFPTIPSLDSVPPDAPYFVLSAFSVDLPPPAATSVLFIFSSFPLPSPSPSKPPAEWFDYPDQPTPPSSNLELSPFDRHSTPRVDPLPRSPMTA